MSNQIWRWWGYSRQIWGHPSRIRAGNLSRWRTGNPLVEVSKFILRSTSVPFGILEQFLPQHKVHAIICLLHKKMCKTVYNRLAIYETLLLCFLPATRISLKICVLVDFFWRMEQHVSISSQCYLSCCVISSQLIDVEERGRRQYSRTLHVLWNRFQSINLHNTELFDSYFRVYGNVHITKRIHLSEMLTPVMLWLNIHIICLWVEFIHP